MSRLAALAAAVAMVACVGCGEHEGPGAVQGKRLPESVIKSRSGRQLEDSTTLRRRSGQAPDLAPKQILFGDLHVHTTWSADAFFMSLPVMQGEGVHPLADACDFARYCSALDFWSITDHAESLTPRRWKETRETIRRCNEVAGDPDNPDVVSFVGFEWTQIGVVPEEHYGHKNVIFRGLDDSQLPPRPISSQGLLGAVTREQPSLWQRVMFPLFDWKNRQRYFNLGYLIEENGDMPICPEGVDTRELPADCMEGAPKPSILFEKLAQGGYDSMVIPHGGTWGMYTPLGTDQRKQLNRREHDPERQRLVEVYSGHGNSEEYRSWRAVEFDAEGNAVCPEPTAEYEPCCWRAGELVRATCENAHSKECDAEVAKARIDFIKAGSLGRHILPWASVADWKDCGQCRDCFLPSFRYRPGNSVQYQLAISDFEKPEEPLRFQLGLIASSDNHAARPGTGYKEYGRLAMTEALGARDQNWYDRIFPDPGAPGPSVSVDPVTTEIPGYRRLDFERGSSFFYTGGLVAVHSEGRDRDAVWEALERREVYGTSGPRILLWFDLLNGERGLAPMGSITRPDGNPRFRVRALGSFEQKAGCPDFAATGISADKLEYICRGECYNPTNERRRISRIEVVRIRPQAHEGEPVARLIQDPWRVFDCPADPAGCSVEFEDTGYSEEGRAVTYYVRAIEEPSMAVNADGLRCKYDEQGQCAELNPCYGDYRTPADDDCLAKTEERAWSSPIFLQ